MTALTARVLAIVRAIPPGRVATYGDVARLAGRPGAARFVGNVMRNCADASVPAHRVTAANGQLGGFGGSPHVKRERLAAEGVLFRSGRLREFKTIRWDGKPPSKTAPKAAPTAAAKAVRKVVRKAVQKTVRKAGTRS
jgi:methylated-DNA-protein-cysteine methyltransferase-like protein